MGEGYWWSLCITKLHENLQSYQNKKFKETEKKREVPLPILNTEEPAQVASYLMVGRIARQNRAEDRRTDRQNLGPCSPHWAAGWTSPGHPPQNFLPGVITFLFQSRVGGFLTCYQKWPHKYGCWQQRTQRGHDSLTPGNGEFQRRLRRRGLEALSRWGTHGFMNRKRRDEPWEGLSLSLSLKANTQGFNPTISRLSVLQPQTNSESTGGRHRPAAHGAREQSSSKEPRYRAQVGETWRWASDMLQGTFEMERPAQRQR